MPKTYLRLLTIAGSDSGGGAGIQADLKTFAALGGYGMSVITALTAQNTLGVNGIFPVSAEFVGQQLDAVLSDIGCDAVKLGMLFSADIIETIAQKLTQYNVKNIVLDTVMVAKSGDYLLQQAAVAALKQYLIPRVSVITPNLPEASVLLNRAVTTADDMPRAAQDLLQLGCQAVLLKGGHLQNDTARDHFLTAAGDAGWFEEPRLDTKNTHGTGCTLSAAIAAYLGQGLALSAAVAAAKIYLTAALQAGADYQLGRGHGPLHHLYNFQR